MTAVDKEKILAFLERITDDVTTADSEKSVARVLYRVVKEGWFDCEKKQKVRA